MPAQSCGDGPGRLHESRAQMIEAHGRIELCGVEFQAMRRDFRCLRRNSTDLRPKLSDSLYRLW